jgi:hypothetical protein
MRNIARTFGLIQKSNRAKKETERISASRELDLVRGRYDLYEDRSMEDCMRCVLLIAFLLLGRIGMAQELPPLPDLHACGASPHLMISPIASDDLASVWPLGHLDPLQHIFPVSHLYLTKPSLETPIPVVSPGSTVLQAVKKVYYTNLETHDEYQEFSFIFGICEGVKLTFGHITPVSSRITDAIAGLTPAFHSESTHGIFIEVEDVYFVAVRFRSGEQIGLASPREYGTDFGAFDMHAEPLPFIHPERYGTEARLNVCPIDLFIPHVRHFLESRLGTGGFLGFPFVPRIVPPLCGTVNQDIANTLQGNWFYDVSAADPEDHHVALVHDKIDPRIPVFSLGDRVIQVDLPVDSSGPATIPFPFGTYTFSTNSSGFINRDFSETEIGYGYCYEHLFNQDGHEVEHTILRVNLLDPETMQIEARYSPNLVGCPQPPDGTTGYPLRLIVGTEFRR